MAWTAPMTAMENSPWTSAQWNTHVRDNLNETAPAKATAANRYMVATATANSIAERVPTTAVVTTSEGTTSTTYADLTTSGPAVTVTTGVRALVMVRCQMTNAGAFECYMGHAVSGATTVAADDNYAYRFQGTENNAGFAATLHTTLTAGSNTFTAKYKSGSGANTATFNDRRITVFPF